MLIVQPALEDKPDSGIAINAARAPFFLVFNDQTFVKSIKNPFVVGGGAGFAVVDLLNAEGCDLFVVKQLGDNMKQRLEELEISYKIIV